MLFSKLADNAPTTNDNAAAPVKTGDMKLLKGEKHSCIKLINVHTYINGGIIVITPQTGKTPSDIKAINQWWNGTIAIKNIITATIIKTATKVNIS